MKKLIASVIIGLVVCCTAPTAIFGQSVFPVLSVFPDFLQGTWKIENQEVYEHWDKLNSGTLKGFSYELKDGRLSVSEYLEIVKVDSDVIYTAFVLNQNGGESVNFKLKRSDSLFVFENPDHDFPKRIVYHKVSDQEIFVKVSDGKDKGFSYKMHQQVQKSKDTTVINPEYDPALAEKLGGDAYGMKSYFLVILKTGTNTTTDKALINESFSQHMANIKRLVDEGKLIVAGPLGKNEKSYRGIFILNDMKSADEVRESLQTDLAIKNGLLDYEIFSWYGSAALPEYLPASDKIWREKF